MIYLDYAAHTPADNEVLEVYLRTEREYLANPAAEHALGKLANEKLKALTQSIQDLLGAQDFDLIYTSGASEANNLSLKGMARSYRHFGKHIITTPLEHPSTSGALTYLKEQGWEVDVVDIDKTGKIDQEHLLQLLRKDTTILTISAVDSELGARQNITEIANILKQFPNCKLHCDAVQAIGKIDFIPQADCITLTAHKIHAPLGVGLLLKRKSIILEPQIHGGGNIYRSGTPTLALIAAFEFALKQAIQQKTERLTRVEQLRNTIVTHLKTCKNVRINSPADASPYILNISVKDIKGIDFQAALDRVGGVRVGQIRMLSPWHAITRRVRHHPRQKERHKLLQNQPKPYGE